MNRVLIILFLACAGLSACTKGFDEAAVVKAQATVDDRIIQDYMAKNNLGVSAKRIDTTGVFYIIEAPGTGNALYTNSTTVTVNYEGRILTSGTVFTKNNGFSPSFVLGEVIKGWQLGIPQIKKGGRVRLLIPSRYAYGAFDQPDIGLPANTVVDFDIQLLDVTN